MNPSHYIIHEPSEEYHALSGQFLSSHLLADFRKSPLLYHKKVTGVIKATDTAALALGRAAHTLILEGRTAFDQEYSITDGPINPKTGDPYGRQTKAYSEWAAQQAQITIGTRDYGFLVKLQQAVWQHPAAVDLLTIGEAEAVVRANYCGEPCQIRMDWFSPKAGLVDLKTCEALFWFESDARRYGYLHQLAFYRAVLREASGISVPVHLIAVEKQEPYAAGVWEITSTVLDAAEEQNIAAITRLQRCREKGIWPTGYETVRLIDNL